MNGRSEALRRLILLLGLVIFLVSSGWILKISLFDDARETASELYQRTNGAIGEPKILEKSINVILADTEEKRILGLSGRDSLAEDSVMLFIFSQSDFHGIWMKEMKFPIDIFWLDENFVVIDEKISVVPETYPKIFYPKVKARYVLEGNADFAKNMGIEIGSILKFLK